MYPALLMPLDTIASAIARTEASSTFPANLFQLFQPMGGVLASPLSGRSARAGNGSGAGGIVASLVVFSATAVTTPLRPWIVNISSPSLNVPSNTIDRCAGRGGLVFAANGGGGGTVTK